MSKLHRLILGNHRASQSGAPAVHDGSIIGTKLGKGRELRGATEFADSCRACRPSCSGQTWESLILHLGHHPVRFLLAPPTTGMLAAVSCRNKGQKPSAGGPNLHEIKVSGLRSFLICAEMRGSDCVGGGTVALRCLALRLNENPTSFSNL